jgi:hypothetical protein
MWQYVLIGYIAYAYWSRGSIKKIIKDAEHLGEDLIDPLVREPVSRTNQRKNRNNLVNYPRISVKRPGYKQTEDAKNVPPNYWTAAEAHALPDGSVALLNGRTPIHETYKKNQPYYTPDERPAIS